MTDSALPVTLRVARMARVLAAAIARDPDAWETPLRADYAERRGASVIIAAAIFDHANPEIAERLMEADI